jgi:hypothetical protein
MQLLTFVSMRLTLCAQRHASLNILIACLLLYRFRSFFPSRPYLILSWFYIGMQAHLSLSLRFTVLKCKQVIRQPITSSLKVFSYNMLTLLLTNNALQIIALCMCYTMKTSEQHFNKQSISLLNPAHVCLPLFKQHVHHT